MRSLSYLLETRETSAQLVNIACIYCHWISKRDPFGLRQDGLVNCPECHALFSADAAVSHAKHRAAPRSPSEHLPA